MLGPLGYTIYLLLSGFFLAAVSGIGIGLAMGTSERVFYLFEPLAEILRHISQAPRSPRRTPPARRGWRRAGICCASR